MVIVSYEIRNIYICVRGVILSVLIAVANKYINFGSICDMFFLLVVFAYFFFLKYE